MGWVNGYDFICAIYTRERSKRREKNLILPPKRGWLAEQEVTLYTTNDPVMFTRDHCPINLRIDKKKRFPITSSLGLRHHQVKPCLGFHLPPRHQSVLSWSRLDRLRIQ